MTQRFSSGWWGFVDICVCTMAPAEPKPEKHPAPSKEELQRRWWSRLGLEALQRGQLRRQRRMQRLRLLQQFLQKGGAV